MRHHTDVDAYLTEAELWPGVIAAVRPVLLDCGLDEEIKWGKPCYSHDGSNIVIVQEFNDFLALMFFKGALMDDPDSLLEDQGENTRSAKRMTFTSADEVAGLADSIRSYVANAIAVEESGLEVPPPELELVEELRERFDADPELEAAFESLTPGRQRGYNLYFSDAKKSETRISRIDKVADKILAGKGLHDL